jgi:hypothetical protein
MSVLLKLIQEREEWATLQKSHQTRRNRMMLVEFGVLLSLGLLVVLHYPRIMAAVVVWLNQ